MNRSGHVTRPRAMSHPLKNRIVTVTHKNFIRKTAAGMRAHEPIWVLTMADGDAESPFPVAAYVERGRKAWTVFGRKDAMGSHARLTYASNWCQCEPSPTNSRPGPSSGMDLITPGELQVHATCENPYGDLFVSLSNDEELCGFFDP
jgi:hypothetical protein